MKIDTKKCYRDYRIVVSGKCKRTLAGIPLLISLVGENNAYKAIERRDKSDMDKCTIRLRRGVKIEIYLK